LATFGCCRSPSILSRSSVAVRERLLWLKSDLLDQVGERPVARWTGPSLRNRQGLQLPGLFDTCPRVATALRMAPV
jgi:hypothetical protein